jgi:hypothetical protein
MVKNGYYVTWHGNTEELLKRMGINDIEKNYDIMFRLFDESIGNTTTKEKHVPFIAMAELFLNHSVIGNEIKDMKRQISKVSASVEELAVSVGEELREVGESVEELREKLASDSVEELREDLASLRIGHQLHDLSVTVKVLKEQTDFLMIESKKNEDKARLEKRLNDLRIEAEDIESQLKHL